MKTSFIAHLLVLWTAAPLALASTHDRGEAPEPRFETLPGSDELRDLRILDIARDDFGFVWLATFSGLVRYDGYEYRWFRSDPKDPNSLSDNRLVRLKVDRLGALWVSTWVAGLNRYDPQSGRFERFQHDPADPESLSDDFVRSLYEDSGGNLWIGTGNGLNRLNRDTGGFDRFLEAPSTAVDTGDQLIASIRGLAEDRRGNLWFGTYGTGLFEFDGHATIAHYRHDPRDANSLSDDHIMQLAADASGTLWIATWGGGLSEFDVETETFTSYRHDPADPSTLPGDQLFNVWVDLRDAVWVIASDGGLARLERESGRFLRYPHDPGRVGSPSKTLPGGAFEDAEGNLWIGTYGNGVDVWYRDKPELIHYRAHGGASSLSGSFVPAVVEDRAGHIWAGTHEGLDRIDLSTGTITQYRHDPTNPNSLGGNHVAALLVDGDGILWLGVWGSGLNRLDPRTGRITRYPCEANPRRDPTAVSDCDPRVLFETSGNIWVGTHRGLNRLDRQSGRVIHYEHDAQDPSSLSSSTINDIKEDASGVLWVATEDGLNRFVPETGGFVRYAFDPGNPDGLVHREVRVVHVGRDDALWLGTGGGLQRFSPDETGGAEYALYAENLGLPRFSVATILDDEEGNLWIATRGDGLWRFAPDTLEARQLDATDGLPRGSFEFGASKMRDGRLLFGGVDGLVIFDPATVRPNTHVPPVVITNITIDNEPLPEVDSTTRELSMRPRARSVSFEFAALDFQAPEKNRYRYRLEGFEEGWTEADASRRFATYTNLDPGQYVFRVKGSNNTGLWNERGASLSLTVMPAWWQTRWFRLAGAISLLAFLFMLHRLRLRYIVETNRQLGSEIEERKRAEADLRSLSGRLVVTQEEERRRVARELHDGVNQRLAMLSMRLGVLAHRPPENAQETSRRFEELKTAALELSRDVRDVSHRLHSSELEHLGLVHALRAECTRVEKESGMEVDLDADEELAPASPDPALCLYRVAQETLMNAVKHSHASLIRVQLAAADGGLELVVSDDGVGFDVRTGSRNGGLGLTSMAERVRYLGGRLTVDSHSREGTEVRAWLPIEPAVGAEGSP